MDEGCYCDGIRDKDYRQCLPLTATPIDEQKFEEAARQLKYHLRSSGTLIYGQYISGPMGKACSFNPRYKMKFLELLLPKIYGQEKASNEILRLQEFVKSLFKEYESTTPCVKVKEVQDPRADFKQAFFRHCYNCQPHDDSSASESALQQEWKINKSHRSRIPPKGHWRPIMSLMLVAE
ncbi:hypothetical protein Tco_0091188 [Tanacetum coccineum]